MPTTSKQTMNGSCHCGAVSFVFPRIPGHLLSCNCTICRRLSTLWAYGDTSTIVLNARAGATIAYIRGDKELAFHTCKSCGCTTHWVGLGAEQPQNMAVNMRLCDPAEIRDIPVRHFDGADTWQFLD